MLRHPAPPAVRGLVEVKQGGVLSRRVRRIAALEGGVLTLRAKDGDAPTVALCVLDASIDARRHALSIAVRAGAARVRLYVPNERKFDAWLRSLRASSRWKVHNFYALGEPIAAGQFATVHSASERVSADLVAVKVVRKPLASECNPRVLQFIRREAYVCRVVEHPAIARVHDVFETPDALYVVMDHFPYTLHDVLATATVLRESHAAAILRAVLSAVRYLHDHKIVHRDIKPDNILCKHPGAPFGVAICDFGLSNFTDPAAERAAFLAGNPELARRRANADQSTSALDARRLLAVANAGGPVQGRRFSDEYADSPASEDSVGSDDGGSDDGAHDPSSPLSAFRERQRAARTDDNAHNAPSGTQSQSFSFAGFPRLRLRRAPSDSHAQPPATGRAAAAASLGSTVSAVSGNTGEPSSWQTGSSAGARNARRSAGIVNTSRTRAQRASTHCGEPPSRRARQQEARAYGVDASIFPSAIDSFTLTSAIGTPCYVAPEIVERERYGPPVDVWGCGLLLYLMLCGRLPFSGNDPSDTLEMIRVCDLKLDDEEWSDVSFGARTLVRGMLQKDPRRRITIEQALAHSWLLEAPNVPRQHVARH